MKGRWLFLAVLAMLAFPASSAQALPLGPSTIRSTPQQYMEVSVEPTDDQAAGAAEADLAHANDFNTIRVIMPWTWPHQAEAVNDWRRLCNIATEAAVWHMTLFLDLVPTKHSPPVSPNQIWQYDTTLGAYMSYLLGPKGCAQGLSQLVIVVGNEPNYSAFYSDQQTAAADYVHLAIRTYKFVHREAARQHYATPVKVMVGELAASHDPVGFMNDMRDAAQAWHFHGPFFDLFSYHCYGNGDQVLTPPEAIQAAMGPDFSAQAVPLLCTEYAVPDPTTQQYCQAVQMAQNSGLAGIGWFRLLDDPKGAQTGLYKYDQELGNPRNPPVAKIPDIQAMNSAAQSGNLICG
jgi:hypothetical protein